MQPATSPIKFSACKLYARIALANISAALAQRRSFAIGKLLARGESVADDSSASHRIIPGGSWSGSLAGAAASIATIILVAVTAVAGKAI